MDPEDLKVARRRIESAICALGGYTKTNIQQMRDDTDTNTSSSSATRTPPQRVHNLASSNGGSNGSGSSSSNNNDSNSNSNSNSNNNNGNIFRRVNGHYKYRSNTADLCSPSTTGSSGDHYKDRFHQRYFVGGQGISWEVEENPPVFVSTDEEDANSRRRRRHNNRGTRTSTSTGISNPSTTSTTASRSGTSIFSNNESEITSQQQRPSSNTTGKSSTDSGDDPNKKIKYRCKLCGVPKQGHICPYSKKLQRTIGVMVCPAVNAYISAEPGVLTLALSEMNNFVPYGRTNSDPGNDESSSDGETEVASSFRGEDASNIDHQSTPGGTKKAKVQHHPNNNNNHHSPNSFTSLSTTSRRSSTSKHHSQSAPLVGKSQDHDQQHKRGQKRRSEDSSSSTNATKRGSSKRPFVMSLALRSEHYRAVTPRTPHRNNSSTIKQKNNDERRDDDDDDGNNVSAYEYPHHVPLTFVGRKRLTDTLFYLLRHTCFPPSVISAEVASLLRTAREKNEWDLAVSEVLTQVVICIHCSVGDYQLDGLRQYLLKIGISS
jgi:hypothetical protein